jgi:TatD DNase family protein
LANLAAMQKVTDTHIHLYADQFETDLDHLVKIAISSGVERFFMPNIDSTSIDSMLNLEKKFPQHCFPMMGLHPSSVKENWKDEMKIVEDWLAKRKFYAVGEMGIDLYWDKTFIEEQKTVFKRQVELANQYKLPIIIHTRDSFNVAIQLLKEIKKVEPCGIFHCFTGTLEDAKQVTDMGFLLGIGGVVTFKNGGLDKIMDQINMKDIVLETDAPYLAPAPFRGKRNEPVYILKVAEKISEVKNISVEEVLKITTENSKRVFGI